MQQVYPTLSLLHRFKARATGCLCHARDALGTPFPWEILSDCLIYIQKSADRHGVLVQGVLTAMLRQVYTCVLCAQVRLVSIWNFSPAKLRIATRDEIE